MNNNAARQWNDQRIEIIIAYLLRTGVILSALLVAAGGVVHWLRHRDEILSYRIFQGEPENLRTVRGLLSATTLEHGTGLIQLGLVLLIFTPIARVAFSIVAFVLERDWTYVAISAVVLGLLLYSFTSA